ncbi:MAG: group III truncated hemoglobin [Saprospiraceae bacterium]|nr:group III truncated hemoglobin [Saprospiraceae bacterium]
MRDSNKAEIITLEDIKLLVDSFYAKVRKDEMLGPIFEGIISDRWPAHLDKMYRFWQTILLEERSYQGSPFAPHAQLPIAGPHFDRWLFLFTQTVDENFEGLIAEEAKWRAEKMAEMFRFKIDYFKNQSSQALS